MPEPDSSGLEFTEVAATLDARHVGIIEIQRPPNNCFDTALIGGTRRRLPRTRGTRASDAAANVGGERGFVVSRLC